MVLDHELQLKSFVGMAKDRCFVHAGQPPVSLEIRREDIGSYLGKQGLQVPGHERPVPVGALADPLRAWAQLQQIRRAGAARG